MKPQVFDRLFTSIRRLSEAIATARKAAEEMSAEKRSTLLARLDSYQEMLDKQESCAYELYRSASHGRWTEVSRQIKIINALSGMIRDDAREIILNTKEGIVDKSVPRELLQ
jgi:hypothetical protein